MSSHPSDVANPASPRRAIRRRLGCLLLLALPLAVVVNEWLIRPQFNPLRRSPTAIERDLLTRTPIGTTREVVEAWVNAQGWPQGGAGRGSDGPPQIQRAMGKYQSFAFTTVVFAEWWFGPDGRLEAVNVYKPVVDAP